MEGKLIDLRFLFKADLLILPVLSCSALYRLLTCSCGKVCDCWALQLTHVSRTVTSSFFYYYYFWWCHISLGALVPQPGIEIGSWQWKRQVLTTGPPGNSRELKFYFPKTELDDMSLCPGPEMVIRHSSCVIFHLLWASKYRWGLSLEFSRPHYKPPFWDNDISSVSHRTCGGRDRQDTRYEVTVTRRGNDSGMSPDW